MQGTEKTKCECVECSLQEEVRENCTCVGNDGTPVKIPYFKVVSDGSPINTKIYDAEGNEVQGVQRITFDMTVDDIIGVLKLEVLGKLELDIPEKCVETKESDGPDSISIYGVDGLYKGNAYKAPGSTRYIFQKFGRTRLDGLDLPRLDVSNENELEKEDANKKVEVIKRGDNTACWKLS